MLPAKIGFAPVLNIPDNAPPLKIDVSNPALSMGDVLPKNFFNLEDLQTWLDARQAGFRVLTVSDVSIELLYDPAKESAAQGEYKPVLWFEETETGLVINASRGQMLTRLAGSDLLARWRKVGQVAIKPGFANGHGQIVIQAVPAGWNEQAQASAANGTATNGKSKTNGKTAAETVEEANGELFGDN